MKRRFFLSMFIIVLGLLLMLVPYYIFPVCEVQLTTDKGMQVPMKCFWTARAVLGCGGVIVFGGILLSVIASEETRRGILLMLFAVSIVVIALPNGLIGVCKSEAMACRMGTLPAVTLLGGLVAATSLVAAFLSGKGKKT